MNQDITDSIVVITSSNSGIKSIGTGFIIHQDEQITYVLTCDHVVLEVTDRGKAQVEVDSHPVEEVINGGYRCDLAVLKVKDKLAQLPALKLGTVGQKGREFIISGYFDSAGTPRLEDVNGKLGATGITNKDGDRAPTWNLEISEDSNHKLQRGYSGSPVIDKDSGYVLGVVFQDREAVGLAISIEALKKVWQEMPDNLIYIEKFVNQPPISRTGTYSNKPEKWLQDNINRVRKDIDIEKENDDYLTDEIAGIKEDLRKVTYSNQKRTLERELKEAEVSRDTCHQNLENLETQIEEIFIEIERRKNDRFT
jgi:hypothetical protein